MSIGLVYHDSKHDYSLFHYKLDTIWEFGGFFIILIYAAILIYSSFLYWC